MKRLLLIALMLWGIAQAQTTGYFRYDSIRFEKSGANAEFILLNGTRAVTGGVLTNMGNGRTQFVIPTPVSSDSTLQQVMTNSSLITDPAATIQNDGSNLLGAFTIRAGVGGTYQGVAQIGYSSTVVQSSDAAGSNIAGFVSSVPPISIFGATSKHNTVAMSTYLSATKNQYVWIDSNRIKIEADTTVISTPLYADRIFLGVAGKQVAGGGYMMQMSRNDGTLNDGKPQGTFFMSANVVGNEIGFQTGTRTPHGWGVFLNDGFILLSVDTAQSLVFGADIAGNFGHTKGMRNGMRIQGGVNLDSVLYVTTDLGVSASSSDSVLVVSSLGKVVKSVPLSALGGGSGATLQDVISSSSVMSDDALIDLDGNEWKFENGPEFAINTDSILLLGLGRNADTTVNKILTWNNITGSVRWSNWPTGGGGSYSFSSPLNESGGTVTIANAAADGSTKGAASFGANDFNASSGNITLDYTNGQMASTSVPGYISTAAQSFLSTKTFTTNDGSGQAYFVDSRGGGETAAMLAGAAGSIFAYTSTGFFGISGPNSTAGFTGGNDMFYLIPSGSSNSHFGNLIYTQTDIGAQVNILPSSTSKVGEIIKLQSSATADGWRLINSSSVILAKFSSTGILGLGTAGSVSGGFTISGSTSGTITMQPQAAAGTYNWNYPTTAGTSGYLLTSGGGSSSAMTWTDPETITDIAYVSSGTTGTPTPVVAANTKINFYLLSGLATNPTFAAPTGTPSFGHILKIRINDNGGVRTLSWNAIYRESTAISLPTSTTGSAGDYIYLEFQWNELDSKWDLVGRTDFDI